tara:strand:+ start:29 stop:403 length:375 start_codon:yes stop_codon:yes gene_type:complete
MNNIQKRFILFLFLCIPIRLYLSLLIKKINEKNKLFFILITLIIGLGFFIIYIGNLRKKGGETFNDNIWWNYLRPFHSFMYLYSSYLIYNNDKHSHLIIFYDTIIGIISFIIYHNNNNNFEKLF